MTRSSSDESSEFDAPETERVDRAHVACDGGTLGHPRVWYQIDAKIGYVDCGYCDKRYVLKGGPADDGPH